MVRVLDLGCGPGEDAAVMVALGFEVVATDRPTGTELGDPLDRFGSRSFLYVDHGHPLPFIDGAFEAVVASLSLHYFTHQVTAAIMGEIARVLKPRGVLVFRVNATDDVEYGARDGIEVEPNVRQYATDAPYGDTKRFFDEAAIREVLRPAFAIDSLEHHEVTRWSRPKRVWECRARLY